jgi:hypothetical protein
MLTLHVNFRDHGFRWPLHDDYEVEVWTTRHELVATVTGRVIRQLVEHHLQGGLLQLEAATTLALRRPLAPAPRRPGFSPEQRAQFRQQRRTRASVARP